MVRLLVCFTALLLALCPPAAGGGAPHARPAAARATASATDVQRSSQQRIDSLRALIRSWPRLDSMLVIHHTHLAWEIQQRDTRAGLPVLHKAYKLACKLNSRDFKAETLLDLADGYILLGEYETAQRWLNAANREFTRIHNVGGQIRCLGRLAKIAAQRGQYAAALDYCFRVPPSADAGDTRRFYTSLQIQIASIYRQLGEQATAESYLRHALWVSQYWDYPDRLNLIFGEFGEVRRQQGRWAEARRYYARSMAISQKLNLAPEILQMEINLAEMDEQLQRHPAALTRGYYALRQARAILPLAEPRVLVLLARGNLHVGRPDSAVYYARQGLRISALLHAPEGLRAAHEVLAQAHAQLGNYPLAYRAQQAFMAARDSLIGAEASRRTVALRYRHQLREQQSKIKLLTQQTRLQQQQRELERLQQRWQLAGAGVLTLLALGLVAAAVWRYRRLQAAREAALRTSLAADLHDDVGSLLTQISMQSTMLREGLYPPEQQRHHLDHMAETSRRAALQMSDVVWGIDARNDSFVSVLDRMRDHAHRVLPPAGLELDFNADAALNSASVPLATRQALYLIYKEALHNAVKHAGATQLTVRLRLHGRRLELEVQDDGRGLVTADRRPGQGLRNMQLRAAAAAGSVAYETSGLGFRVVAHLPLG